MTTSFSFHSQHTVIDTLFEHSDSWSNIAGITDEKLHRPERAKPQQTSRRKNTLRQLARWKKRVACQLAEAEPLLS